MRKIVIFEILGYKYQAKGSETVEYHYIVHAICHFFISEKVSTGAMSENEKSNWLLTPIISKVKPSVFKKQNFKVFIITFIYLILVNIQSRFSRGVLNRQVGFPESPISKVSLTWIWL